MQFGKRSKFVTLIRNIQLYKWLLVLLYDTNTRRIQIPRIVKVYIIEHIYLESHFPK